MVLVPCALCLVSCILHLVPCPLYLVPRTLYLIPATLVPALFLVAFVEIIKRPVWKAG